MEGTEEIAKAAVHSHQGERDHDHRVALVSFEGGASSSRPSYRNRPPGINLESVGQVLPAEKVQFDEDGKDCDRSLGNTVTLPLPMPGEQLDPELEVDPVSPLVQSVGACHGLHYDHHDDVTSQRNATASKPTLDLSTPRSQSESSPRKRRLWGGPWNNVHDTPQSPMSTRSKLSRVSAASSPLRALRLQGARLKGRLKTLTRSCNGTPTSVLPPPPPRPDFTGEWTCIATWGLGDFLKAHGISMLQRIAAEKAPWPSWEFDQDGDKFTFFNRGMMGELKEEFEAGGPEYTFIDGRRQQLTCKAFWKDQRLIIERCGPQGRFREDRYIEANGHLTFELISLQDGVNAKWGRSFERKRA
jgi:hypothetical protein